MAQRGHWPGITWKEGNCADRRSLCVNRHDQQCCRFRCYPLSASMVYRKHAWRMWVRCNSGWSPWDGRNQRTCRSAPWRLIPAQHSSNSSTLPLSTFFVNTSLRFHRHGSHQLPICNLGQQMHRQSNYDSTNSGDTSFEGDSSARWSSSAYDDWRRPTRMASLDVFINPTGP